MNDYLPPKNNCFFNPGKPGAVFSHAVGTFMTIRQLLNAQEHFVQLTKQPVIYIEDRRLKKR